MTSRNERFKSLAPGDRLGSYEVLTAIGAGRMDEVYRAFDTALGREVALKVLSDPAAADETRLRRFERDARILASLNHPNIAAIHGVTQCDTGPALVLELVEGLTLQDCLAAGALPLDTALQYARQIAAALEAAHEKGIVHRDLKPANIKVRPDGTLKVLDFGIARIVDDAQTSGRGDPAADTRAGFVVRTTYYMSPEQARGGEITRRSDVWAFGAILYEMLTGNRPFGGRTPSEILAAILTGTPDWSAIPASTPPVLDQLIRSCLERDPRARLHDIGDARIDIDDVISGNTSPRRRSRSWRKWFSRWLPIAMTLVTIAALVFAAICFWPRAAPISAPEVRLEPPPEGTHFVSVPALSPDGQQIAFVAQSDRDGTSQLWVRALSAAAAVPLQDTDGAMYPFWSPDSRTIAYFADGRLMPAESREAALDLSSLANKNRIIGIRVPSEARIASCGWAPMPVPRYDSRTVSQ